MKDALKLQGLALLLVVFVVGLLGGMAVERVRMVRRAPPPPDRVGMGPGIMPPMFERLGLTEDQRVRIREILEESRPVTDSVLRSSLPRLRAIRDSVRLEVRAVLTPEQQERFDEMERRWGDRGPGEWGGPMGPGERGRRGGPRGGPLELPPPDSR
jgi:Spy/CpxP family protein refolding chaperone